MNEKKAASENTESGKEYSAGLAKIAIAALEDKKAEDVRVIDIADVSVLADYFIIASGNNRTQVQAMADEVEQRLGRAGAVPRQVEGYQAANWVLLDFGDVIIHIFDAQNRLFYDLERIWKDGTQINPDTL
ncbi:MAG: ribosome silencing factor [Lachnospiraceae bacterium]|nr:ribosome silencing factor [Lachnospiraceae bacterium]MDO4408993.1 ribosome silencing factor [Eubacteriales bacterium]